MKSIFVPIGGGNSDTAVMETALAIATPLHGHIEFLHVHVSAGDAARHTPHVEFARGPAIQNAMATLERESATRTMHASRHVLDFCSKSGIAMQDHPDRSHGVTAGWREESGDALKRLLAHARHHDLVVLARRRKADGLPANRLETLLLQAGRPLVVAPAKITLPLLDHVMICWKESADAARALSAAMPILVHANHVHVVAIAERNEDTLAPQLAELVQQLRWSAIEADYSLLASTHEPVADTLLRAAHERSAGLIVMGGYGHSYTRQFVFGGCTRNMLENTEIDVAVFLAH